MAKVNTVLPSNEFVQFNKPGDADSNTTNNPSDFPSTNVGSAPKVVTVKVTGTPGAVVRLSNPA